MSTLENKIIIKNGLGAPGINTLSLAELGLDVNNNDLYIGSKENGPVLINPIKKISGGLQSNFGLTLGDETTNSSLSLRIRRTYSDVDGLHGARFFWRDNSTEQIKSFRIQTSVGNSVKSYIDLFTDGTIALNKPLSISQGGTNASTAEEARDKLGITIQNLGGVPNTRTINNHPLSSNITLSASDVGALSTEGGNVLGNIFLGNDSSTESYDLYLRKTINESLKSARFYWRDSNESFRIQAASAGSVFNYLELRDNETYLAKPLSIAGGGTGASNRVGAIDNLKVLNLDHITDSEHLITEGADLNNYSVPGAYRCNTSTIAKTLLNAPSYTGNGFRLLVSALSNADTSCVQFAIFNSTAPRFYFRTKNSSGTWGVWTRIMTNILTADEYGSTFPSNAEKGRIFFKKVGE